MCRTGGTESRSTRRPGYFATELTQALAADEQFSAMGSPRTPPAGG